MTPNDLSSLEDRLRQRAAEKLIACGITLQSAEMQALSVANPYPHTNPAPKGKHPRARTFNLRNSILYAPTSIDETKRTLLVRVGYAAGAFYGPILARRGWLGMIDTLAAIRGRLRQILGN